MRKVRPVGDPDAPGGSIDFVPDAGVRVCVHLNPRQAELLANLDVAYGESLEERVKLIVQSYLCKNLDTAYYPEIEPEGGEVA